MKRNTKLGGARAAALALLLALPSLALAQDGPMVSPSKKREAEVAAPAQTPAQTPARTPAETPAVVPTTGGEKQKGREQSRPAATASKTPDERLEPDDTSVAPAGVPDDVLANRREQLSEEQSIVPYYNNFLTTYRLGPEDIISVDVFNQPRYSKTGITIPPNGRISYPLIRGGVFVSGKTTEEVAQEISEALDEYIIDPQVTVSLDKAQSAVYGVMGDVAQPGIRPMSRRLSVYDALMMAGGVLPTGDKKKVILVQQKRDGILQQTVVDVAAIEKGKAPNGPYLNPGDQVFVPGNRMKKVQSILNLIPIVNFFRVFTGGF